MPITSRVKLSQMATDALKQQINYHATVGRVDEFSKMFNDPIIELNSTAYWSKERKFSF